MADTKISALTADTAPADADVFPFVDTSASATEKVTWSNIKAALQSTFDTLYAVAGVVGALDHMWNNTNTGVLLGTDTSWSSTVVATTGGFDDSMSSTNFTGSSDYWQIGARMQGTVDVTLFPVTLEIVFFKDDTGTPVELEPGGSPVFYFPIGNNQHLSAVRDYLTLFTGDHNVVAAYARWKGIGGTANVVKSSNSTCRKNFYYKRARLPGTWASIKTTNSVP